MAIVKPFYAWIPTNIQDDSSFQYNNQFFQKAGQKSFYLYNQIFGNFKRSGIIAAVKLEHPVTNIILPHENIIQDTVDQLIHVYNQNKIFNQPIHVLYEEENDIIDIINPIDQKLIIQLTDSEGVKHEISKIEEAELCHQIALQFQNKQLIIADGHHRYAAGLVTKIPSEQVSIHSESFLPMYLTNKKYEYPNIKGFIRLVETISNQNDVISCVEKFFNLEPASFQSIEELYQIKENHIGLILNHKYFIAYPKNIGRQQVFNYDAIQILFENALNIKDKQDKNWKNIKYSFNFTKAVQEVQNSATLIAVVPGPIHIDSLFQYVRSGKLLPEKATYFYPKVKQNLLLYRF